MNRYTYKAKRKDNNEWVYGYYYKDHTKNIDYIINGQLVRSDGDLPIDNFDYYEIIPETLCQCTGLQDKEGNYIFENDIFKDKEGKKLFVKWDRGQFDLVYYEDKEECWKDSLRNYMRFYDIKIIGNKYDKEKVNE